MFKKILIVLAICFMALNAKASPEYDTCYSNAKDDNEVALCMKAETARTLKEIQQMYLNTLNIEAIKTWNKGVGLTNGNLKDMYNSWLAYRNRYCSLYNVASQNDFGSTSFNRARCLFIFTNDHYDLMKSILIKANSGGEEDD